VEIVDLEKSEFHSPDPTDDSRKAAAREQAILAGLTKKEFEIQWKETQNRDTSAREAMKESSPSQGRRRKHAARKGAVPRYRD
jgi:hypothetical protein